MMRYLAMFLYKTKLLQFFNFTIKFDNAIIPVLGELGYDNTSKTEKWMGQILSILLSQTKNTFVDVGVNVGQTLIKVKKIDPNINYIGFEPNSACLFYNDVLISKNNWKNCKIIPIGISSKTELLTLTLYGKNYTDSSATIIEDFRKDQTVYKQNNIVVGNSELTSFLFDKKIGVLKIDVEGAESNVFEGLKPIIARDLPVIVIEVLPVYFKENGNRYECQTILLNEVKKLNYSILKILKNNDDTFLGLKEIETIGINDDIKHSDYIFVPHSSKMKILKDFHN